MSLLGRLPGDSWDFGDGATSTEQSPSHEYAMVGTYDVQLVVTGRAAVMMKSRLITSRYRRIRTTIVFLTKRNRVPEEEIRPMMGMVMAHPIADRATSLHSIRRTGDYVTLVSLEGMYLTDVQAVDNPSPTDTPEYLETPFGFIGLTVRVQHQKAAP